MELKNKNIDFNYLVYFLILIPFFRFSGLSNFKWPLILVEIGILFAGRIKRKQYLPSVSLKWFKYFFVWCLITIPFARNMEFVAAFLIDFVFYYLFYLLVIESVTSGVQIKKIEQIFLFYLFVEAIFVAGQVTGIPIFTFLSEDQRSANAIINSDANRYWGTMNGSLTLASFVIPIGIYFFMKYRLEKKFSYSYSIAFLTLIIVLLSGSRFGLLVLILLVGVALVRGARNILIVVASALTLVLIPVYFLGIDFFEKLTVFQRFNEAKGEADGRVALWQGAYEIFFTYPTELVGTTLGNLNYYLRDVGALPDFVTNVETNRIAHVESVYITILVSTGVIGAAFFIAELVVMFRRLKVYLQISRQDVEMKNMLTSIRFALAAICLVMLTEPSYFFYQNCTLLLLLFMGLLYSKYTRERVWFISKQVDSEE